MAPAIPPSHELPLPFGAYLLLEQLGTGAAGAVYLAKPLTSERALPSPVVIKRMLPERVDDPDFVRRFRHEARVAVLVDSPHVAGVFDVGSVHGELYIAMEYVRGWPLTKMLGEVIAGRLQLDIAEALEMIIGALEGLRALHELRDPSGTPLDVVHRDLSPRNLMVGADGAVRIIDLGIGLSRAQSWKTKTGRILGPVGYMPPEQLTGRRVDQTADLYAVGVIAHELISGRRFIDPGPVHDMMRAGVRPEREPLAALRTDVPPALDRVLDRVLSPEPEARFGTAREVMSAVFAVVPQERLTGRTRELVLRLYGVEIEEQKRHVRELLGRAESTTEVFGSETDLVVFATGARFPVYDASLSVDTDPAGGEGVATVLSNREDSGLTTEPPQLLQDTMRLSLDEIPAIGSDRTVLIPSFEPSASRQARVDTRITPAPQQRSYLWWVAGALLLLTGVILGVGTRALVGSF